MLQAGSSAAATSVREMTKYGTLSASSTFFSGGGRDSWSNVRRGSQPHNRNRQKNHALHSRSTGNYVPVPTFSMEIQHFSAVWFANTFTVSESPSQPVQTYDSTLANFKTMRRKFQSKKY